MPGGHELGAVINGDLRAVRRRVAVHAAANEAAARAKDARDKLGRAMKAPHPPRNVD
jgi:hypothetical protein